MMEKFEPLTSDQSTPRLVITCDWQGTINEHGWHNLDLLLFLSDAKKAGHRVIITTGSNMRMETIPQMLDPLVSMVRDHRLDMIDPGQFEIISKKDLQASGLKVHYAFDNKPIAEQRIAGYVHAEEEIRVHKDFSTSPYSLTQLREDCGLPPHDKVRTNLPPPAVPLPSRAP